MSSLWLCAAEGDWNEADRLVKSLGLKNHQAFMYAIYKQQYLEQIDGNNPQKALALLVNRLKPLESLQSHPDEFRDLCYLLSCKSVQDAPSFKSWEGVRPSRERLLTEFQSLIDLEGPEPSSSTRRHSLRRLSNLNTLVALSEYVQPDRLLTLFRQALAYQLEFSPYHSRTAPKITT